MALLRDSHPSLRRRLRSKLRESKKGIGRIKWNARFKRKTVNAPEYLLDVKRRHDMNDEKYKST